MTLGLCIVQDFVDEAKRVERTFAGVTFAVAIGMTLGMILTYTWIQEGLNGDDALPCINVYMDTQAHTRSDK